MVRMAIVAGVVTVVGALASVYLAVVGVSTCDVRDGVTFCREVRFYPLTAQRRSDVMTKDGVPHGARREWHKSGGLWFEGSYVDGERAGAWRELYPDGTIRFEGGYKNDKLDGVETWYFPDGRVEWQVGRVDGKRDGEERWYHRNGALRRIGRYRAGEPIGTFTVFDEDGAVAFSGEYVDGALVTSTGDER